MEGGQLEFPRGVRADLGAVATGVVGAAVVRLGAFEPLDAVLFPTLLVTVGVVAGCRVRRHWRPAFGFLVALGAWWLLAAFGWGRPIDALPFFGGIVGFGAAVVMTSNVTASQAVMVRRLLVYGGAAFAAVGIVGVGLRVHPLATQAQGLWRLSGTITYANAAGLLLALVLPLALAERERSPRWNGVAVTLLVGALIATMSRGAGLALLVVGPLLWGSVRRSWWPLLLGLPVGLAAVATASSAGLQPLVLATAGATALLALLPPPRAWLAGGVLVAALAVIVVVPTSRTGILEVAERRLSPGELDDRTPEWRGAAREFARAPILGTGPERPFLSAHSGRTELARFAHSEPLQVAMSAGLVGLALLTGTAAALYRPVRRGGPSTRAARAGLLVFAIEGLVDFSWHFPALGILAGVLAALAAREDGVRAGQESALPRRILYSDES